MQSSDTAMLNEAQLNKLFQYAMTLCQQRDDAYDLLQAAVEKYLVEIKLHQKSIEKPEAFVRVLIRNRFIDQYRQQQYRGNESFEEGAVYDVSLDTLEQSLIDSDSLEKIWAKLSAQDRDIFYHWAVLGYSTDETCRQLEMSRGTLLSRIHRLRKRLAEYRRDDQAVKVLTR